MTKRPREDGGDAGRASNKAARSKAAPKEPPALLRNRTCAENPRWLAGHMEELLEAAATAERGTAARAAEDALHGFILTVFEGGCELAGSCVCDRAKKGKDKATLWTLANDASVVGLFQQLVHPTYHGVVERAQAPARAFGLRVASLCALGCFGWPLPKPPDYVQKSGLSSSIGITTAGAVKAGTAIRVGLRARNLSQPMERRRAKNCFTGCKLDRFLREELRQVPFDTLAQKLDLVLALTRPVKLGSHQECQEAHAKKAQEASSETQEALGAQRVVAAAVAATAASSSLVMVPPSLPQRARPLIAPAAAAARVGAAVGESVRTGTAREGGGGAMPAWGHVAVGMQQISEKPSASFALRMITSGIKARGVVGGVQEGYAHPGAHTERPMTADEGFQSQAANYLQIQQVQSAAACAPMAQFTPGGPPAQGGRSQPSPPWSGSPTAAQYEEAARDNRHPNHDAVRPTTSGSNRVYTGDQGD